MATCDPNSISINIPDAPSGSPIGGFGLSFSPSLPNLSFPLPDLPDLSGLFALFAFPLPFGELKSPLNPNYGKDIVDAIIKLLDQFMPFLMAYKFFLPFLKLLLCILEIICAIPNPFKVAAAVQRLFRECIPLFLSLFPIIALLLMIISLLLLLIQLIAYLIALIVNFINLILRNIFTLIDAITSADEEAILAIVAKIGRILCLFQNLFVVLLMINLIIQIFKDILNSIFSIPPCDDSDNSSFQNCCTPDVCPRFIKNSNFKRTTGIMQYTAPLAGSPQIPSGLGLESILPFLNSSIRTESFQFYDPDSSHGPAGEYTTANINPGENAWIYQQLINMVTPRDQDFNKFINPNIPPPIFFPTDATYNESTPPGQAPYTVDIKVYYDPAVFDRIGPDHGVARFITFKDCIVINPASISLAKADNTFEIHPTGVVKLAGGKGYEEDGSTILYGYNKSASTGDVKTNKQATLETFLFKKLSNITVNGSPQSSAVENVDFVNFKDIEYTFKINHAVLVSKNLITYSCLPDINRDRAFTNAVFSSDLNLKIAELKNFPWPDITKAQECLNLAIDAFRNNLTKEGAETLQSTAIACLQQLQAETENAINKAIPLAFDQYKSTFTVEPSTQFTTDKIKVKVDLKESSGSSLVRLLPPGSANYIANKIFPSISFGNISSFTYDGSNFFEAEISSQDAGSGTLEIAFENKKISDITPEDRIADLTQPLSLSIRQKNYSFIYAPSVINTVSVGTGDASEGQKPRRDESDIG